MDQELINKPLVHPKCFHDEFPIGYLLRLTELNRYKNLIWFVNDGSNRRNIKTAHYFYDLLKHSQWTGFKNNTFGDLHKLQPRYFEMKRIRFCTQCLKDSMYIRTIWQIKPSLICRKHKVWLQDSCGSCDMPLTVSASKISECECGNSILNQETLIASPEMIKLQEFLEGEHFDEVSNDWQRRITIIYFFNRWLKYKGDVAGLQTCTKARNSLEDVAEALFSGRVGFMNFLRRLHSLGTKMEHFNQFINGFHQNCPEACFSNLKSMIEEYINQNWEKPLTRRNSNISAATIFNHPWIPLSAAARDYDFPKSLLKKAISNGYIRFKKEITEKKTSYYLYRPDIEDRYFRIKDIITAKEARLIIGLSKKHFFQMVEAKAFEVAISPKESGRGTWCFSHTEMIRLEKRLNNHLTDNKGDTWTFSEVMKHFCGKQDNFLIKLTDAIDQGELKAVSFERGKNGYASLNFSKKEIISWIEIMKYGSSLLSIPVLAKVLGINQQFAYELVWFGCIRTEERADVPGAWISQESLKEFNEKYVLLSKLSKKIDLNSRALMNYLATRGAYPIDHESNTLRQKVYERELLKNIQIVSKYL